MRPQRLSESRASPLRALARRLLDRGALPERIAHASWVQGDGAAQCAMCERPVRREEPQVDEMSPEGIASSFHVECHAAVMRERIHGKRAARASASRKAPAEPRERTWRGWRRLGTT